MSHLLSFVVPAHNEAADIAATIRAIAASAAEAHVAHEIVVVDDSSSDATGAIAAACGARVVTATCRQIAASRNTGARAATGSILVFVDADTTIDTNIVTDLVGALQAGAVGGGASVRFDEPVPRWVRIALPAINAFMRFTRLTGGCFVFCTRADFSAVGGFDETLYAAEEIALCRALRKRGAFVILPRSVLTSGRKVRTYSGFELLGAALRVAFAGRGGVEDRSRLGLWYDARRSDPRDADRAAESRER